jgi:hypothetical protein
MARALMKFEVSMKWHPATENFSTVKITKSKCGPNFQPPPQPKRRKEKKNIAVTNSVYRKVHITQKLVIGQLELLFNYCHCPTNEELAN